MSNKQGLVVSSGLFLSASLLATTVAADIIVNSNTISWPNDGWYQVQSTEDFSTVCQGGASCEVAPGRYHIINHSTGERWENITVGTRKPVAPLVEGNTIIWQEEGWHQVQDRSDYSTACEGGTSCTVDPGTYVVINHASGLRWDFVTVNGDAAPAVPPTTTPTIPATPGVSLSGNSLTWSSDGWFQVQDASSYETICSGTDNCLVEDGTYNVINHSTGERFDNIVVGDSAVSPGAGAGTGAGAGAGAGAGNSRPPSVNGYTITLSGRGWYQVQNRSDFSTVCEGVSSCTVAAGSYLVVNHSTGERWSPIDVRDSAETGAGVDLVFSVDPNDPFGRRLENQQAAAPADGSPSTPMNLRVELIANDWVEFNWTPSADDGEIVAYNIYRDDMSSPLYVLEREVASTNGGVVAELQKFWQTTSFIDCNSTRFSDSVFFCNGGPNGEPARGPEVGAAHVYRVSAVDNDGNESALSNELSVQLHEQSGSVLGAYEDPYRADQQDFPVGDNLSTPSSYLDRFDLIFDEDFNGSALDPAIWNTRLTWGPDVTINSEKQYFVDSLNDPNFGHDPFSFNGSTLTITASPTPDDLLQSANDLRYLSGALSSYDKFGFTYGYVESRIRVSGVFGALSTFYLFHRYPGEHGPEIDIVEYLGYNQYGDENMFQTYHYQDSNYATNGLTRSSPTMSHANSSGALYSQAFHTYGMLWEPGLVVWYIDGVEVKRLHGPQISRQQMNLVTYLVTGSAWTKAPDEYTAADELVEQATDEIVNLPFLLESDSPVDMEIDYIRVWQRPEHQQ